MITVQLYLSGLGDELKPMERRHLSSKPLGLLLVGSMTSINPVMRDIGLLSESNPKESDRQSQSLSMI